MGSLLKLHLPYSPDDAYPHEGESCECVFYDESYDRYPSPHADSRPTAP